MGFWGFGVTLTDLVKVILEAAWRPVSGSARSRFWRDQIEASGPGAGAGATCAGLWGGLGGGLAFPPLLLRSPCGEVSLVLCWALSNPYWVKLSGRGVRG